MEPRVQYAKTADGISIAFTVLGEGPPLVLPPAPVASHLQLEWDWQSRRALYERFAERATVVRYDPRGVGMSQRDVIDFSLEACSLDLEGVIRHLGIERFALLGRVQMGDFPIAYAARHHDRVSHLVVWQVRSLRERGLGGQLSVLFSFAEQEWELFTNVFARLIVGWDSLDATPLAGLFRASHSPQSFRAAYDAANLSPMAFAKEIRVPTLVLHPLGDGTAARRAGQLASEIAHAQVLGIPGEQITGYPTAVGITAILDFINTAAAEPGQPIGALELDTGAFRTILFTDIEEHTAMMQRLGDVQGREVLREHERVTRDALRSHGGAEVKTIGDSFMASFPSAQRALECAIALQQAFEGQQLCGEQMRIRIGLNAGEPIAEEDDLFGSSVILAARAKEKAEGGEIVVTDVVRQLVIGKGFLFADRGEIELRGFEDPVRLYELRWRE